MDIWRFERELIADGYQAICGVDEAGRGPLAGPVFAAAVILPPEADIQGLNDSKKISEKKRIILFEEIKSTALSYGIAFADHREIDELNILKATFLAMNRAVDKIPIIPDFAMIDGNRDPSVKCRSKCIVSGDAKSASIAAASILAKVSRDRHMAEMAEVYPEYGFDRHKGYPTKLHYERLHEHSPCEIHRTTFLSKWEKEEVKRKEAESLNNQDMLSGLEQTSTQERGKWGEAHALEYLKKKGYSTAAIGYRSRFGEIDLIVKNSMFIVFVEVKLRKNTAFAHARESVGKQKQKKMTATANIWLASHKTNRQPRFDVIEIYAPDNKSKPEIIHIENAF